MLANTSKLANQAANDIFLDGKRIEGFKHRHAFCAFLFVAARMADYCGGHGCRAVCR